MAGFTDSQSIIQGHLDIGFSQTFRTFTTSFPLVIIMLLFTDPARLGDDKNYCRIYSVNTGEVCSCYLLLHSCCSCSGYFFKVLRYGSVTSLMELNQVSVPPVTDEYEMISDPETFTDFTMESKT